jgi:hypothetical protein
MIKVTLKDGTILNCNIYETDKAGDYPIINHERINYLFNRVENKGSFIEAMINFQTSIINGKFHPVNVESYEILHENKYSYEYPRADGYMRDWY